MVRLQKGGDGQRSGISKRGPKPCCCRLAIALRAQLLKKNAWLLHQNDGKALFAVRYSSEVANELSRRCYHRTGNGGHSRCLGSSLSFLVGLSIPEEAVDVAQSAPQGAHYHADAIDLPLN